MTVHDSIQKAIDLLDDPDSQYLNRHAAIGILEGLRDLEALHRINILENTLKCITGHDPLDCKGHVCPLHNMTDHPQRTFPQNWRVDRQLMERICPCGIGHPDTDHVTSAIRRRVWDESEGIHGCCGKPNHC